MSDRQFYMLVKLLILIIKMIRFSSNAEYSALVIEGIENAARSIELDALKVYRGE